MAEGGGLLNRYTVNSRIVGSNPIPSASPAVASCTAVWRPCATAARRRFRPFGCRVAHRLPWRLVRCGEPGRNPQNDRFGPVLRGTDHQPLRDAKHTRGAPPLHKIIY